jgi:RimJ/RimL family protein N-acetyltransferase
VRYLFYTIAAGEVLAGQEFAAGYDVSVWRPARDGLPPSDLPYWPNAMWWLFDRLRVFRNRNFGVLLVRSEGVIVHRSLVSPPFFRFPDMGPADLQVGDTWTHPAHRGRGLAKAAIHGIHRAWAGQFQRMWYIVGDANLASRKVIEACGYRCVAHGERTRPLNIGAIGQYKITGVIR